MGIRMPIFSVQRQPSWRREHVEVRRIGAREATGTSRICCYVYRPHARSAGPKGCGGIGDRPVLWSKSVVNQMTTDRKSSCSRSAIVVNRLGPPTLFRVYLRISSSSMSCEEWGK